METKNGLHPERGYTVPSITRNLLAKSFLIESTKFQVSLAGPNYCTANGQSQNA